ncbi:MAG: hypothetical protein NWT08_06220 [Akkermansiaceae bacterium]|jgi:hypothetical protein|nr:hypothetical protein [Akkermansiaceae bacterium]MDP4646220.1 hypothetical protein [Akkermansiaceae bacterium]MDP4720844.1 hypothetical protein [Akkermansiaceae bacterium]MDP4780387.1 hypothetical protein [Akkermansiaceae bacterium]MDP4846702.1 hypothetical protein [Akkermansiaceae bacterium]
MNEIHGAPSFSLKSDLVSLHITREGGHLAPVEFTLGERTVSPYSLSPWKPSEVDPSLPPLLKNLRGDFLCLPFGPQENAPPHGETANHDWEKISETPDSLSLAIEAADVSAKITKTISLHPGQTALYISHTIEGLEGDWNYGNHPILDFTGLPDESVHISVSPFRWASVYPEWFSNPSDGAHQALKIGALFSDLKEVPLADGGTTDLTRYPARPAAEDLVMMVSEEASTEQPFAWSACVLDGYVWFALKNPADFPATLFWISNGGRSAEPWDSRHISRIGIEEVCSHFCDGVDISRKDLLHNLSVPTSRRFSKDKPVTLKLIQAVAAVPTDFGLITSIVPDGENHVTITDEIGTTIRTNIDWRNL